MEQAKIDQSQTADHEQVIIVGIMVRERSSSVPLYIEGALRMGAETQCNE